MFMRNTDHSFNYHVFVFHRLTQAELQILDSETDWKNLSNSESL